MFGSQLFGDGLFQDFRRLEQQMDELLGRWPWPLGIRSTARGMWPPMNIGVTPENVEVYLFAAGIDPKSLDIDGAFRRVISLPEDVDPDRIRARYRDGVLQITAERPEAAKPRHIEVH
jgi:HSP20 family protein